jgi:hypothetical protein
VQFERRTEASIARCASSDPTPMKDSNEGAEALEESPEGRPLIKENMMEQRTDPTPSGDKDVSTRLQRVRRTAGEKKQERFTALLHHVTVDLLKESF